MSRDSFEIERWIEYSLDDLLSADYLLRVEDWKFPRNICYLCQQSIEKIIKSLYIFQNQSFPRVHDLDALRNLLSGEWMFKANYPDLSELSEWAVESRYPNDYPPPEISDAKQSFQLAKQIIADILNELQKKDFELTQSIIDRLNKIGI